MIVYEEAARVERIAVARYHNKSKERVAKRCATKHANTGSPGRLKVILVVASLSLFLSKSANDAHRVKRLLSIRSTLGIGLHVLEETALHNLRHYESGH